jgi:Ser/Thr protein kinase RdoA (MazF antagonist)
MMDTGGFGTGELATVLDHYDLGSVRECSPLRRGDQGVPKLYLRTEKGSFVLKKCPLEREDPYQIAMAHDLQLYMARRGFALPKLIGIRRSDSTMLRTDTAIYEIHGYIEGQPYDGSRSATISAGQWLHRFQECLGDYNPVYEIPHRNFHNNTRLRKSIQQIPNFAWVDQNAERDSASLGRIAETLLEAYNAAAQAAKAAGHDAALAVVCHGDWHPGNMIFRDGQVIAVLDYGSVRSMPALNDVAIGCLQFSLVARGKNPEDWPDYFDLDRLRWFLEGYHPASYWSDNNLRLVLSLMIEALIAEAVTPVAVTGRFANHHGGDFLGMVIRKVNWLRDRSPGELRPRIDSSPQRH